MERNVTDDGMGSGVENDEGVGQTTRGHQQESLPCTFPGPTARNQCPRDIILWQIGGS
jgi:hypothetical protein